MANCSLAVKPTAGRYPKIFGSQAPQMKNSRTIMTKSFFAAGDFMGILRG
jgi:hypothetical protein